MTKKNYTIALLPGDGIGPEVAAVTADLLTKIADRSGFSIAYTEHDMGGVAIDNHENPLPDSTLEACLASDAVLLGAVGGPKWDHHTGDMRPESGLLKLRKELGVYANLRPVSVPESLASASPLRLEAVQGTDLFVVRELTGGLYFGEPKGREGSGPTERAWNTMVYSAEEIDRVARIAFDWARKRRSKVTSVDKANVLVVSQLWRDVVNEVHKDYADVELSHMYVDNAAMQLILNPGQFDVIVTGNIFGDILSDAAATLGGSLGLLPSASVGGKVGLFEPVHGSAPDIAGQGKANPIACLLSGAMLLDYIGEPEGAEAIRKGVVAALDAGHRTADLHREGMQLASTSDLSKVVADQALALLA